MIFCQYNYKEFNNSNKHEHPTTWNKMVDGNTVYCERFNILKWTKFWFYIYTGKIKLHEIPSCHPYFKYVVQKRMLNNLVLLYNTYFECKKDTTKIKYYFNSSTTINTIEAKIKKDASKITMLPFVVYIKIFKTLNWKKIKKDGFWYPEIGVHIIAVNKV